MRRRRGVPPPKPFDQAFANIDTLEQNVAQRTVHAPFELSEVAEWLWPVSVRAKLRAAYPVIRRLDRTDYFNHAVTVPMRGQLVNCTVAVRVERLGMLCPAPETIELGDGGTIPATLASLYETHLQFEKVRKVTRWLNEHATVGAARHYCPWLAGVLPADHAFNEANGQIFREPVVSMAEIVPVMRECGVIMASALLAGEPEKDVRNNFMVHFSGIREAGNRYVSNQFNVL